MEHSRMNWSADVHVDEHVDLGAEVIDASPDSGYARVYLGGHDATAPVTVYLVGADTVSRLIRHLERALLTMTSEREACPYCHDVFRSPAEHDPLKRHLDLCPERPSEVEA